MKNLSQTIALVAVTTLFATAFTTSHFEQQRAATAVATSNSNIVQIVIVGKRMSAVEKAQYDAEAATQNHKDQQSAFHIAVK